jgi:anti-sigma factor RsiW
MTTFLQTTRFRMDHRWAVPRMSQYVDGELPARALARLQGHLADCEECQRVLRGLQQMLGLLHDVPPVLADETPDIAGLVERRLREPPPA